MLPVKPVTVTTRILVQVAVGAALVIAVTTAVTYAIVYDAVRQRDLNRLATYASERARREEAGFRHIEDNLKLVRGQFLKRMEAPVPRNYQAAWEQRFRQFPDGAWRSREEFSDGRKYSTLWAHKDVALTPEFQTKILRAHDICEELLRTWADSFPSLYFNFPGPANVGFDPTIPSWVWDTPADYDMDAQEWVYLADAAHNPSRGFVWTGVLEEEITRTPQVAVMLPVDSDGAMLCSIAHSIPVGEMMEEATRTNLAGTSQMVLREDGRLIAHPTQKAQIVASKGHLTAQETGDAGLISIYRAIAGRSERQFAGYDETSKSYYSVARLAGPEWLFVTRTPSALLREQAFRSARWVLWSGLLSLALLLAVFAMILRNQIALPLRVFLGATRRLAGGETGVRVEIEREDEFGRLARDFNDMGRKVEARTSELRDSEERWRALFEQLPLSVQIFAPDGTTRMVNRGYESFWKASLQDLAGYNVLQDRQLEDNGVAPLLRRAFAGEVVAVPAAPYDPGRNPNLPGGATGMRWLSALLYPLLDSKGSVREVICIHEDITERKKAEDEIRALNQSLEARVTERTAQLRQSEERFSKAFQASPAMMTLTRLADGAFIAANDAFYSISGFTAAEVIGSTLLNLNVYAQQQQRDEYVGLLKQGGSVRDREHLLHTKAGEVRTLLVSGELFELEGQLHVLTVGLDITDRKEAEVETLKALDREKELSELKTNFVSMVSHEFRTPLGVIMSAADVLDRYLDRLAPEQRREHLEMIFRSTRNLAQLVESVLLLGKVEDGRMQFTPRPLDLAKTCRELVDEMGSATSERCPIELEIGSGLEGAQGDSDLFRHIFSNLLGNAAKYSEPGVPVSFAVERCNGGAVFTVRDRGIGIPAEDQANLFKSFARGGNVGQRPGSGLGLLIVKRCTEQHGGTVQITSQVGTGTTVTVTLPVFPT
jgi:PAS domain S-box-containing protein